MKNKAISNIKKILSSFYLNDAKTYLKDGPTLSDVGFGSLHPSKGTHWVVYLNENYFDSYGCVPTNKLSKFILKRNGYCVYSEYKIQNLDSYCASYCLYINYMTKVVGLDHKSAVLSLYYRRLSLNR